MPYTRRKRRGGNSSFTPAVGTSATTYVSNNYGDQNSQFDRVMSSPSQSNVLYPLGDTPTSSSSHKMSGGRRKKRHSKKRHTKKKGGFFFEVVKQAIVPFSLLALNNSTRLPESSRKNSYSRKRFKSRRRK
jgi:hypothetical protein